MNGTIQKRTGVATPTGQLLISNSSRSTFLDCPYKWYLEYVRKLTPRETPEYFVWGAMVHYIGDQVAKGKEVAEAVTALQKNAVNSRTLTKRLECLLELLPLVFDGYLLAHQKDHIKYEVIVAEKEFELDLGNDVSFVGKLDRLVRRQDNGELALWETKTPAQTGKGYFNRLQLDAQIQNYLLAVQKVFGYHCNRVIYDTLKKPQTQGKVVEGETAARYADRVGKEYLYRYKELYERTEVVFTDDQIESRVDDLRWVAKQMRSCLEDGYYIMHHPGNRIGGCQFFNLCVHGEESYAKKYFTVRTKFNPELAGGEAE